MLKPHILLGLSFKGSAAPRLRGAAAPLGPGYSCLQLAMKPGSSLPSRGAQSFLPSGNICSHRYNTICNFISKTQNLNVPKHRALFSWHCSFYLKLFLLLGTAIITWKSLRTLIPCCSASSASLWLIKHTSMKETCTTAWSYLFLS